MVVGMQLAEPLLVYFIVEEVRNLHHHIPVIRDKEVSLIDQSESLRRGFRLLTRP